MVLNVQTLFVYRPTDPPTGKQIDSSSKYFLFLSFIFSLISLTYILLMPLLVYNFRCNLCFRINQLYIFPFFFFILIILSIRVDYANEINLPVLQYNCSNASEKVLFFIKFFFKDCLSFLVTLC